jgi:Undecaprenyl-phosphate glucose phosphotransferase
MNTREVNLPGHQLAVAAASASLAEPAAALSAEARAAAQRLGDPALSGRFVAGLVRLAEFTVLVALGAVLYAALVAANEDLAREYGAATFLGAGAAIGFIHVSGGYRIGALKRPAARLGHIFAAWTLAFAALAVTAFFLKVGAEFSRAWLAAWYLGGLVALVLERAAVATLVRRAVRDGRLQRRAVIVGGGAPAANLIAAIESERESDLRICGIFDDRGDERSPARVKGYPKLGTVTELVDFARLARIDMLIVAVPLSAESRLLQMLKTLWVLPVDIRLSMFNTKLRFRPRSYSYVGSIPFLDLFDRPIAGWDSVLKRAFDLAFGVLALVLVSPIMLATALAIKLDSRGPVLFRQKRYGFNNELIEVFKFRSMYTDRTDPTATKLVTKDDPRVTRVGRFIRKTSIDELPQLFNVIFGGNLSLVGPRPHALHAKAEDRLYHEAVQGYFARHRVKPGITGWAQINGWRGETDSDEKIQRRVEHDLEYIERWSVLFDLYILFLTPFRLIGNESAY